MLTRRLEPEVMDTVDDARDYDAMDHSTVNRVFVDDLLTFARKCGWQARLADEQQPWNVLDVGTGTALIPIELCRRESACRILAIDLAAEMLKLADRNIAQAGFTSRIQAERIDAKQMPYATGSFEAVISNSIVHHIPEPRAVITEMLRVLRPGGVLFVRDLLRPQSLAEVDHLVATYAGRENAHSQQLFRDSLHAALSLAEVRELAAERGIDAEAVTQASDRHWTLGWLSLREPMALATGLGG
ncbi:MAG: class I SAM-dependent methyltransferase [Planctomycetaceae bacterium]